VSNGTFAGFVSRLQYCCKFFGIISITKLTNVLKWHMLIFVTVEGRE